MDDKDLPKDGTRVIASTYPSIEYDREARKVSGKLYTRRVESLGYTQCWVNGVQVDPASVRLSDEP